MTTTLQSIFHSKVASFLFELGSRSMIARFQFRTTHAQNEFELARNICSDSCDIMQTACIPKVLSCKTLGQKNANAREKRLTMPNLYLRARLTNFHSKVASFLFELGSRSMIARWVYIWVMGLKRKKATQRKHIVWPYGLQKDRQVQKMLTKKRKMDRRSTSDWPCNFSCLRVYN